jgi:O-antigen/teichoic acid export membrane protein
MTAIKKLKDITAVSSGDIFGSAMSAVFWFYLASQIGPGSYGEIHWFLGIAGIFSTIALFGTVNTITVYTAKKIQIQSTLNFISLSASVVLSFIVIVFFPSFYTIDIGIILIAYVINTLAIGDLLGRKQYANYSKYTLVQKGLTLGLGFLFFYLFGYEAIIFALACSYLFYVKRIYSIFREMKIDFSLIKQRMGFITNNYLAFLLSGAIGGGQVDKIIVAPLLGFAILGNYSLALQIIHIMMIFPGILYKYLLPQESTGVRNKQVKIFVIIFSISMSLSGIFIAPTLIENFFPKFIEAVDAIKIMSLVVIPGSIALILEAQFLGNERSKIVIIGTGISLVFLTIGMIVLGSWIGIIGVAWSLVIAVTAKTSFYLIKNFKFT